MVTSRRTVLATGTALGGALATGGVPAARAASGAGAAPGIAAAPGRSEGAWCAVLDDADLVWQRMPRTWYEGPFLGNGRLGSGIYAEPGGENAIRFTVPHSEVQDHRPQFGSLFGLARLPIGRHFTLEPVGTGAFLLGAVREQGRTRWVRLTSEAGAPCVVRHGLDGPVDVRDDRGRPLPYEDVADGTVRVPLGKGETALITARGDRPDLRIRPVPANEPAPPWGLPA